MLEITSDYLPKVSLELIIAQSMGKAVCVRVCMEGELTMSMYIPGCCPPNWR